MKTYNGAHDILPKGPHCRNCIRCRAVLEDDLETGILLHKALERGEELGLGVHDGYTIGGITGDLSVQVENNALLLHGLQHTTKGIE